MSKFIIALIATTFTMTAFADNHANHTPMSTPMVESAPAMAAPKHSTKEMHAKKAHHHAKQAKHHTQKAKHHAQKAKQHHSTAVQKPVTTMPVTN